ncbi:MULTISPECIES: CCA tRNA nucleotidyltransferase [unclassified Synechococcus]|uniref:CCA tRNA nucleotidyltransferase n=1 Tax=unclassified Synechococcus TaxID=2626047 RepID=UPI0021A5A7B3|nr:MULTISPECIES: CCA tRNA nucleotidyltransferase [unclassified Synechococcus]MCT0211934.1 CCA tRNA nucleotidyltransferase [Synechococcus sp. CS-1326]MCT0232346.1 CCA tRNA nucleotidyltransferase [Synechococcus sp. CS-1327]
MHIPRRATDPTILGWSDQGSAGLAEAAAMLRRALRIEAWPLPLAELPAGAALVGGAVRDGLLQRLGARPDLDLVVPGDAISLCRELSRRHGGSAVVLDGKRSIARLVLKGWCLDLARQVGSSLEEDLWRRDFRLNALALPLGSQAPLLDPTGGLRDLALARIVAVREANLLDDPLRLLRGIRLAAELGFKLDDQTGEWIRAHHRQITEVAPERVLVELEKLAACPAGQRGLAVAFESRLLDPWLSGPGVLAPHQAEPNRAAQLLSLQRLDAEQTGRLGLSPSEAVAALGLARLAVLFDAKGLERLHASRQLQRRCGQLQHWWNQLLAQGPGGVEGQLQTLTETQRLSLHQQLAEDLPSLLLFFPPAVALAWMKRWRNPDDPLFHPRFPVDGWTLQQTLGLGPSRQVGQLLAHLSAELAFGRINKPEEALKAARIWLESRGL